MKQLLLTRVQCVGRIDPGLRSVIISGVKKILTVYSQGLDDKHAFDSYFEYTAALFPAMGFKWKDIVCTNRNDPKSAERNKELMIRACEAGKRLAIWYVF